MNMIITIRTSEAANTITGMTKWSCQCIIMIMSAMKPKRMNTFIDD